MERVKAAENGIDVVGALYYNEAQQTTEAPTNAPWKWKLSPNFPFSSTGKFINLIIAYLRLCYNR